MLAYFGGETGADVKYVGSDSFKQQIMIDTEAGSAPNVVVFPQPGLAADMAGRGFLAPLEHAAVLTHRTPQPIFLAANRNHDFV